MLEKEYRLERMDEDDHQDFIDLYEKGWYGDVEFEDEQDDYLDEEC